MKAALTNDIHYLMVMAYIAGLFFILLSIRVLLVRQLRRTSFGIAVKKLNPIFLLAVSVYLILHLTNKLNEWATVAHKFIVIATGLQIAMIGHSVINQFVVSKIKKRAIDDPDIAHMQGLLTFGANLIFYIFVVLLTLDNLGIDISTLVAGLGVGGVAVALALQSLLSDLLASLTIILDKPFVVGDAITIGDFTGELKKIGLKNSRLLLKSGETLIVANGDLLQSRVRNLASRKERLATVTVGVAYETSTEKLKSVPEMVRKIVESKPKTRFSHCHLTQLADSSLNFECEYWVDIKDDVEFQSVKSSVHFGVIEALRSAQIEIAYPTRTLYITKNTNI